MINLQDIHSLTEFARNTREHARRLKKTGRPEVLTVNGRAEFVVQDAKAYQELLDLAAQAEHLLKMQRSLSDMEDGRVHDFEDAVSDLKKTHFSKKPSGGKRGK